MIRSIAGGHLLVRTVCVQIAFAIAVVVALGSGMVAVVSPAVDIILGCFAAGLI